MSVSLPSAKEVPSLSEEKLRVIIEACRNEDNWIHLIRTIGAVFSDPDALVQSFRKEVIVTPSKEEIRAMEVDMDKDEDEKEREENRQCSPVQPCESMSSDPGSSLTSCPGVNGSKVRLKDDEVTVNLDSLRRAYTELFAIPGHPFQAALINAIISLSRTVEIDLRYHSAYDRDPNYLNIFLIVMEIPSLHSPEFIKSSTPLFCKALGQLPLVAQVKLARVWSKFPVDRLQGFVACMQQLITVKVVSNDWSRLYVVNDDEGITSAAKVLKVLYCSSILGGRMDPPALLEAEKLLNESADDNLQELLQGAVGHETKEKSPPKQDPMEKELGINPIDCREPLIPWEDFVNEPLSEQIEMDKDYTNYKASEAEHKFSFMTHSFLLTTAVKNLGMYYDSRIRMLHERRTSLLHSIVHGAPSMPYLRLRIRRDHIIDDALVAVSTSLNFLLILYIIVVCQYIPEQAEPI